MQIFVDFVDRLVSVKRKTMGVVTSCKKVSHALKLRSIEQGHQAQKLKSQKYLMKDYGVIPQKLAPAKIFR